MNSAEKKRSSKTTRGQYELYLNELSTNEHFRDNKFDATNPDVIENTWQGLCGKLIALGGPVKSVPQWKRTFTDWKSQVKGKARRLKVAQKETGNAGDIPKNLTDLEERLLNIIGQVVITGMDGVPELGTVEPVAPVASYSSEMSPDHHAGSKRKASSGLGEVIGKTTKKRSLTSCLNTLLKSEEHTNNVLPEINKNLKDLLRIQKKRLKLQRLELALKYPGHRFSLSSELDSD